jgi:hypothetical protein
MLGSVFQSTHKLCLSLSNLVALQSILITGMTRLRRGEELVALG